MIAFEVQSHKLVWSVLASVSLAAVMVCTLVARPAVVVVPLKSPSTEATLDHRRDVVPRFDVSLNAG